MLVYQGSVSWPLYPELPSLDVLGEYMEYACHFFGYDKLLPMNTGAEAVETALKLCRRWGYRRKGVAPDCAKIIVCGDNFSWTYHYRDIDVDRSKFLCRIWAFIPDSSKFRNDTEVCVLFLQDPDVTGF